VNEVYLALVHSIETVVPKRRGVGGILLHADEGIVISGRDLSHVKDGETRTICDMRMRRNSTTYLPTSMDVFTQAV
jgi:hypothetical protein